MEMEKLLNPIERNELINAHRKERDGKSRDRIKAIPIAFRDANF